MLCDCDGWRSSCARTLASQLCRGGRAGTAVALSDQARARTGLAPAASDGQDTPDRRLDRLRARTSNAPARVVAAGLFERVLEPGQVVIGDEGFTTLTGIVSRIVRRLLASTAILHTWQLDTPGRRLTAYDHRDSIV